MLALSGRKLTRAGTFPKIHLMPTRHGSQIPIKHRRIREKEVPDETSHMTAYRFTGCSETARMPFWHFLRSLIWKTSGAFHWKLSTIENRRSAFTP